MARAQDPDGNRPGTSQSEVSGSSARDVVQTGSVSGGIHFHDSRGSGDEARGRHPTPRQLPHDITGFVNRTAQLDRLDAVFVGRNEGGVAASICVIAGTAGAGKTSLALRWAHQIKDRFPDGQLHINLRGYDPGEPVTAQEALHRFLTALGTPASSVPRDPEAAAALYRSLLADRRVLVFLDNAATAAQVRPLLPGSAGCLVVVTSRNRLSGLAVRDGAWRLTLGTLPEHEAVALLRTVTTGFRSEDDGEELAQLARLCARLPLALRIAAERAAGNPYLSLDDLIAQLRDESALWDALSTGDGEETEAVRTVFSWSYRALPPGAARLFRLLGLHPGPDIGLHAAAALAGLAPRAVRQSLDVLVGAHLLEQTAPDRYEFHDLLRAFATERVRAEEPDDARESALLRVLDWYLHAGAAAQRWLEEAEDRPSLAPPADGVVPPTFADYDAAADWAEREHTNLQHAVRAAVGHGRIAWQLAAVWFNARSPSAPLTDWVPALRHGRAEAERLGARSAEALLLTDLGMAYTSVNRLADSRDCYETALRICRELGDREGVARALNSLGLVCLHGRRLADAARYFEQAVTEYEELRAPQRKARAQSNLASAHYRAGRLEEAEHAVQVALAAHQALDNRRGEGNVLRLLSELRCEQGRTDEALRAAETALEIALTLREHHLEGYWLLPLGDAQRSAGRLGDALTSYQRSAVLHRRLGNRSREAVAWHGAGETYHMLERPEEARHFSGLAAATHRELGDTWNEALCRECLAEVLLAEGSPEEAHAEWTEAARLLTDYDDPRAVAVRRRIRRRLEPDG